jgi:hypothetical protein
MCVARDKTGSAPAHDLPHAHYHEFCKQARKATKKKKEKKEKAKLASYMQLQTAQERHKPQR